MSATTVGVVGAGYVGLTTAACLASLGNEVIAVDIDEAKVALLQQGVVPILEEGLDELVARTVQAGQLRFSARYADLEAVSVVLLCLPTPFQSDGGLDLSYVRAAVTELRSVLNNDAIVVTKSTVPVGTHELVTRWLDRPDVHVAANPEFLCEGTAVRDFLHPDRIVIGAPDRRTADRVASLYARIEAPTQKTDQTSAELIKYASNSFLATKLSFVNEISRLCDQVGADIDAVTTGIGSDRRIGTAFLRPGPGWGGSCFPKDTRGLTHLAREASQHLPVCAAAHHSNLVHLDYITDQIEIHLHRSLKASRIAIWGATFKAGTNDLRDSPAIEVTRRLQTRGAELVVYDPEAARGQVPFPTVGDAYSACCDADMLVVLTEWPEFGQVDLHKVRSLMRGSTIYDTRYIIDIDGAARAGICVHQPGRPHRSSLAS